MEKEEFHRDPMTEVIGAVGPFQIVWHVVLGLSIVIHAWQMFANKWLTYKVQWSPVLRIDPYIQYLTTRIHGP